MATGKREEAHFIEHRRVSTVHTAVEVLQVENGNSWMTPLLSYMRAEELPRDEAEAREVKAMAPRFTLLEGILYRRSHAGPLLRCITEEEGEYVLREIHEGVAGAHEGEKMLAQKSLRQGYYWPSIVADAQTMVKRCRLCQEFATIPRAPPAMLTPISSSCPFAKWGMNILGPFPRATGQKQFIIAAIDYFSKWLEAVAVSSITEKSVKDFVKKAIICRFGIPRVLISDNGPQFASKGFKEFCEGLQIKHLFASICHPQTNGLVENSNRTILHGLRCRVAESGDNWVEELDHVLWSFRTTPRQATGETPFSLVYGAEAVLPVEIGLSSYRTRYYADEANGEARMAELDMAESLRNLATQQMSKAREAAARQYNRKVRPRTFHAGDWVMRRNEFGGSDRKNKLSPKWEGPYKIINSPHPNAFTLEDAEGKRLPRTFNAECLRKFYF